MLFVFLKNTTTKTTTFESFKSRLKQMLTLCNRTGVLITFRSLLWVSSLQTLQNKQKKEKKDKANNL